MFFMFFFGKAESFYDVPNGNDEIGTYDRPVNSKSSNAGAAAALDLYESIHSTDEAGEQYVVENFLLIFPLRLSRLFFFSHEVHECARVAARGSCCCTAAEAPAGPTRAASAGRRGRARALSVRGH